MKRTHGYTLTLQRRNLWLNIFILWGVRFSQRCYSRFKSSIIIIIIIIRQWRDHCDIPERPTRQCRCSSYHSWTHQMANFRVKATHQACIQNVPGSNLCWDTGYSERCFRGFTLCLQETFRNSAKITARSFPFKLHKINSVIFLPSILHTLWKLRLRRNHKQN
jgi:hypothetical protein